MEEAVEKEESVKICCWNVNGMSTKGRDIMIVD